MKKAGDQPLKVYGVKVSYYTGKMENYLRYKEIPYEHFSMDSKKIQYDIRKNLGVIQVPNIQLPDGRWMTDTTPMIQWFEEKFPDGPVIPDDLEQAFFCLLLEDYADEWLWRPAMHYRWHYQRDALSLSRYLSEDVFSVLPLPKCLTRLFVRTRQRTIFTTGDGIDKGNIQDIEATYLNILNVLQSIFEKRPFMLGDKPSLADIAFSGPMFRHFSIDPTPALIMRETAPAVYEWTARLWNTRYSETRGIWMNGIPDDWGPILDDIGSAYFPYLCANIEAWKNGEKRFSAEIDGVVYEKARTSHYRVWCLEILQKRFNALPDDVKEKVQSRLEKHQCWEPMWRHRELVSGLYRDDVSAYSSGTKVLGI